MKTIAEVFNIPEYKGSIGIEIEMEPDIHSLGGNLSLTTKVSKFGWLATYDGSIANGGVEYVTTTPVTWDDYEKRVKVLYEAIRDVNNYSDKHINSNSIINNSFRAGVHVHVNVQSLTFYEVLKFATLWYAFESSFVRLCGEERVGNHFCLGIEDTNLILSQLRTCINNWPSLASDNDNFRYSALNWVPLSNRGSLEIRCIKTTDTPDEIISKIKLIEKMFHAAKEFKSCYEIASGFSERGYEEFAENIFGTLSDQFPSNEYEHLVGENISTIQMIALLADNLSDSDNFENGVLTAPRFEEYEDDLEDVDEEADEEDEEFPVENPAARINLILNNLRDVPVAPARTRWDFTTDND